MIEDTPLHEHPPPHPSTDDIELNQGRSHKQPWQPVAISIAIISIIFGIILL